MTRYAAISSAGLRHKSDSRESIDAWCADRVKLGESCEVYARVPVDAIGRPTGGVERIGSWRPI